jgi:hypothetical protein
MFQSLRKTLIALSMAAAVLGVFASTAAASPPEAITEAATAVSKTSATLHGTVRTTGAYATWYAFQYGPTTEYGKVTEIQTLAKGSKEAHPAVTVGGLTPDSRYHFKLIVFEVEPEVFVEGEDRAFTTEQRHPPRFEAERYPASLQASQSAENAFNVLTIGSSKVQCKTATFHAEETVASAQISLAPEYSGCTWLGASATVLPNSCHYLLSLGSGASPYPGTTAISCTKSGDAIEIQIAGCTAQVLPQTPTSSNSYEVQGSGSTRTVTASVSASKIKVNFIGKFVCAVPKSELGEGATMGGTLSFSGLNEAKADGLFITGDPQYALYLTGEKSEEAGKQPHFETETLGAPVQMEPDKAFNILTTGGGSAKVECGSALFTASTQSTSAFRLNAALDECTYGGLNATVKMNSCYYVLNVANANPPYSGSMGIGCEKTGDAVEVSVSVCTVTVPAQTPSGTAEYENRGTGSSRSVHVSGSANNVLIEKKGLGCGFVEKEADSFGGAFMLTAYQQ